MKPILEIHNISKRYKIEHLSRTYPTFREKILQTFQRNDGNTEEFWALKNVSFDVHEGDALGIIGRNGAGKSTLLKILSKITPPTKGKIVSRGRIASLLEVGTGFHPELTGRENIYFNGSLLGMKRKEIDGKFDEIVDFSGVEKFLDTPLKHFSSGMQLRLAFAVAAFLEPEILIIDEVLAVGDAEFQKKCLGKMEDVSRNQGRTIFFVSHNMGLIKQLCHRVIWLQAGATRMDDGASEVVNKYLSEDRQYMYKGGAINLNQDVIVDNLNISPAPIHSLGTLQLNFDLFSKQSITVDSIGFYFQNVLGERVGIIDLRKGRYSVTPNERISFTVRIERLPLIEGEYEIGMFLGSNLISNNFDNLIALNVEPKPLSGDVIPYPTDVRGSVEFEYDFHVTENKIHL